MADRKTKVIKARRDSNGNVEVALYGRVFDVTQLVKNGVAQAKLLGEPYEIHVIGEKKLKPRTKKSQEKTETEAEKQ